MPPSNSGGDELSLRHLPDVSDTSFSFQIPLSAHEENLLAENDQDFFQGAYLSPLAPVPPTTIKNTKGPLTLSQLTPRPRSEKQQQAPQNLDEPSSFPTLSYDRQDADQLYPKTTLHPPSPSRVKPPEVTNANGKGRSKPRPKLITPSIPHLPSIEGSPAGARLEAIKAEVDLLAKDELIQSSNVSQELDVTATLYQRPKGFRKTSLEKIKPHSREEKRNRQGRTSTNHKRVFEGGITKPKTTDKAAVHIPTIIPSTDPIFSLSERTSLSKDLKGDEESLNDTSACSMSESDGVAARLVKYGQKLINPFGSNSDGLANSIVPTESMQDSATLEPATGTHTDYAQPEPINDSDRPLTLSQLSPRKKANGSCSPLEALTPPASVPMSPLRPSSKRPVSVVVSSEVHQWKKTKADASTAAAAAFEVVQVGKDSDMKLKPKQAQQASSRTHPRSDIAAVPGPSRPNRPAAKPIAGERGLDKAKVKALGRGSTIIRRAPPPPAFKLGSLVDGNVNNVIDDDDDAPVPHAAAAASSKSTSTSTSTSRIQSASSSHDLRNSRQRTDDLTIVPVNSLSRKGKGKLSTSAGGVAAASTSDKPPFHIPVIPLQQQQQATRPVEFHFRTSSRSESRTRGQIQPSQSVNEPDDSRSQSSSRSSSSTAQRDRKHQHHHHHHYHDIPDFKALHAAQEAKLALLKKENLHPTVPLPIKWETDQRVKERQKYDEMVREKEREQRRLKEEERRRREEEEERELRELRKKSVPKAHEVPEWYQEAPKKKDKTVGRIG